MSAERAALAYAARGVAVFPCVPGTKRPAVSRGLYAATVDANLIRKWWSTRPRANVGIFPARSGLVVIDIDCKEGKPGYESLAMLEGDCGPLPETTTARTPSGGEHFYFRAPSGVTIPGSHGEPGGVDAPGVDVQSGGYYVVAPPSTIDGRPYTWTRRIRPVELAPAWVELLTVQPRRERAGANVSTSATANVSSRDRYASAALDAECSDVAATAPGRRNHALNRAAFNLGQLVGSGDLDEGTVRERLLEAASECGLGAREARRTIRSRLRAGMEQPRERTA